MQDGDVETNGRIFTLIGAGSAVLLLVVLTAVGELALENVYYGATAGVIAGLGGFLFLPWWLRVAAIQEVADDDVAFSEIAHRAGDPKTGTLGAGLELGGIAMIAVGFAAEDPNPVYGVLVAVAVALSVFLVASFLLDR